MKKLILFFVFILFPVFTFAQALNGTYVIGNANTNNDFKTLTAAVAKINAVGVTGPVTFLLDENFITTLSQPITFTNFSGSSTVNTLTIKPNIGKNVTITASNANGYTAVQAVFKFDGADNIIIDGSNTAGGTSRDLLLNNTDSVPYTFRTVIWVASNASNGANNIKILNTKFKMAVRNSGGLLAGVFSGSGAVGSNNSVGGQIATAANSNLIITNNEFFNVRQGIVINSSATESLKSSNIQISNNNMGSTVEVEKPLIAVDISNAKNVDIVDNTFDGLGRATVGGDGYLTGIRITNSSNFTIKRNILKNFVFLSNSIIGYGIHIVGLTTNAVISENKITNIKNPGKARIRAVDLEVTAPSSGIMLANNFISDISALAENDNTESINGIYIWNGSGTKIYHNTVALNASAQGESAAIRIQGGTGFDVRNNIFANTSRVGTVSWQGPYAIQTVGNVTFSQVNNNSYFASFIGKRGDNVSTTLLDWKTATGKDANSVSANPLFVSSTDLHLQSVAGNAALDNAGTPITVVPKDIDGQTRSTSTPDIGAAEFSAVPIVMPTVPASALTVETASVATGLTVNMAPGNGANRLVLIHSNSAVNAIPVDGVTYNANPTFGAGSQIGQGNYVAYAGSGTSATITGLSECTKYYMAVYEYNGTGTNTKYLCNAPAMAAVGESTTFENGTWSKGMPNNYTEAIIESNYTLPASMTACKLTIRNNANVIVPANYDVILNGPLVVESGSEFKMASNTNLIQETDVQNSGVISVERQSSSLFRLDYTMWGSPVIGSQTLKQFSPQTVDNRFYIYNSSTDVFNTVSPVTAFTSGKGYLIRMPDNHTPFVVGATNTPTAWTGTFVGTPTNGDVSVNLESGLNGFNMLSNPYASMIDAKKFLTDNSAAIEGTIYFWRRRNAVPDASAYYATYTYAGGTSVPSSTTSASGSETPNGFIQVGQGFIVKKKTSATTNTAIFNNSMRTQTEQTNQFFKNSTAENSGRVWLNVTNAAGEFGQTLVAYLPEADNEVDFTDGKYLNDGTTALTSWLNNSEYIIQGRAPFTNSDVVALNFKTATGGTYTIAVDKVDGLFEGTQAVFLRDNLTGVLHDLKGSVYTFATQAGSFNTRFDVVYQNPLSVENSTFDSSSIVLFKKGNNLVINSGNVTLDFVEVYDLRGRLLALAKNINANEISINVEKTNQMLIVKITSTDGISITKKTIN